MLNYIEASELSFKRTMQFESVIPVVPELKDLIKLSVQSCKFTNKQKQIR